MKIGVIMRQVPDLVEPLEVADSGTELDLEEASFLANESDEHALEQAILLKESAGAEVTVIALDFGDVDNTLYTAAARGADRIIKISLADDSPPDPKVMAAELAEAVKGLQVDLVLIGCWSHDELQGPLGPRLAHVLGFPFVGVIRGVELEPDGSCVRVYKEFPGAARARIKLNLPAVLGIQGAEQPPRYVPVNRIRAAMKSTQFEEREAEAESETAGVSVSRLYAPERGDHAEIISGSPEEIANRIADILREKGVVK